MANGWMKTLQCKSRAADDVRHHQDRDHHSNPKNHHHHHLVLLNSVNCRNNLQNIRDIVENEITKHKKPKPSKLQPQTPPSKGSVSRKSDAGTKQFINKTRHGIISGSGWLLRTTDSYFPEITELQEGHPSRNVVEIIFHTSWGPKNFPGRIEMVFKVQNLAWTVTRFEEYREVVKSRARSRSSAAVNAGIEDHARCVADGNEMMRFHCLGATSKGAYDGGSGGVYAFNGEKRSAICTFSETGGAHLSAGGGRGRKAMLVCRVIAGRVCKQLKFDSLLEGRVEYDTHIHAGIEDHARCVADGKEMMRFHCLGATSKGAYDGRSGGVHAFNGEKRSAICTFFETGGAHLSAGGGRGRKAMLVCRVIAGRVCKQLKFDSLLEGRVEYDTVSGENGEFLVFDSRAFLPCFLVIYKL